MDRRGFLSQAVAGVAAGLSGCAPGNGAPVAAEDSPLLAPFQGQWRCDIEQTLAARKAGGASDDAIGAIRALLDRDPKMFRLHPDLTITDVLATGDESPVSEYRFFGLHRHDDLVCGKAWHHEDRHDPGDMSACRVRLRLVDGRLHLAVRMQDGLPDLNSPDLVSMPVEGDASRCDADSPSGPDWGGWETYVFHRP